MTLDLGDDTGIEAVAPLTVGLTLVTVVAVKDAVDVEGVGAIVVVVVVTVVVVAVPLGCLRNILDNI